jgi:hypothetical protein
MIWLPGAAYFSTLNVKRNFQYAPHCAMVGLKMRSLDGMGWTAKLVDDEKGSATAKLEVK